MKISDIEVTYLDHMGDDLMVVNAARVSFDKQSEWEYEICEGYADYEGGGYLSEKDEKLIKYLAEHNHWSPAAHPQLQFRIKAPIFIARQLQKHTVGCAWNEVSRRYVDSEPEVYVPYTLRAKAENKKQGSSDKSIKDDLSMRNLMEATIYNSLTAYEDLLDKGVAPEVARGVLPQATHTEWVWTGSFYYFARVCNLRLDPHAQKEVQDVASGIYKVLQELFPVSTKYFVKEYK